MTFLREDLLDILDGSSACWPEKKVKKKKNNDNNNVMLSHPPITALRSTSGSAHLFAFAADDG